MVAPRDGFANKINAKNDEFNLFHTDHASEQRPFSADELRCCVSFVDMVHSTEIIAQISNPARIRKYYSAFINAIAVIARHFNAKIIKNTGDCLIYYFPKTFDCSDSNAFKDVINCGLAMIEAHPYINRTSNEDRLPDISYRISADYGNVQMNRSIASTSNDLLGPVMNLCSRMNSMASPNGMVIGTNLYRIINRYYANDYDFEQLRGRSVIEPSETYYIYTVTNKNNNKNFNLLPDDIESLQRSSLSITERQGSKEQHHNVLIVDDEPDALFTYKTFLVAEGFNVETFTIPEEALDAFAKRVPSHYSLVIVDIRMPRLNGLQLYHRLKRMSMSVKVLFLSALDAAAELVSILPNANEIRVIKKPVDQEHFISAVRALLVSNK